MNEYMSITDRMRDWDKQTEQLEKENAELKEKLEKEKCELCGIIQGKDKYIQELEKESDFYRQEKGYYTSAFLHQVELTNRANRKLSKAKEIMEIAIEGIKHWGMICGKERPYEKLAELEFNLFLEKAGQFLKE